ncbi:MAG: hypothetical protein ABIN37_01180 [Burkholderiaceae bacterium]
MNVGLARLRCSLCTLFTLVFVLAWCPIAWAADYSLLGFGTVGYAISDQKAPYLRYIDKQGTFKADSLIGLQAEVQINPQWGATVQVVGSAPRSRDENLEATIRWAFVSYRPSNEWLIRAGRIRPPVLMNTQNAEVGMTYDAARLPAEVYSLSPVYDIDGVAVTRSWSSDSAEVSLDGYIGRSKIRQRTPFQRDASQTFVPDKYFPEAIMFRGLVLSYGSSAFVVRAGAHYASLRPDKGRIFVEDPSPMDFPAPPPFGGTLFVPGAITKEVNVTALTLGGEMRRDAWRAYGELGRRMVSGTNMGPASTGAQVSLAYEYGNLMPYVTASRLASASSVQKYYKQLRATPVPIGAQGPPLFLPATYHGVFADAIYLYDQRSIMIGASYKFTANSKLKVELMRTKVGLASALVDGDVHHKSFNVLSMSYNFVF